MDSKKLFNDYQSIFLKIANHPLGRKYLDFNKILPGHEEHKVQFLGTNCIHYEYGNKTIGSFLVDNFIENKFSTALKVGGAIVGGLSYFGAETSMLMPLAMGVTYSGYSKSGDGRIRVQNANTWSDARNATQGSGTGQNTLDYTGDSSAFAMGLECNYDSGDTHQYYINRMFFPVDTSSIPSGVSLISGTFRFYFTNSSFSNGDSSSLSLVETTQSSTTSLSQGDFNNLSFVSGGDLALADINSGQNAISFNATGLGWINVSGDTKIGVINSREVSNVAVTADNKVKNIGQSEDSNTDYKPLYTIVYSSQPNRGYII